MAKIYLENIKHNARAFSALTKKPICAVVKANGYGHGAEGVVCALESEVSCFAVSLVSEAIAIFVSACGRDILVLTPPLNEEETVLCARLGCIVSVGDLATAYAVVRTAEKFKLPVRVHIKANTGMNRYGANLQTLGRICACFKKCAFINVEGIYSHLYGNTKARARAQRDLFCRAVIVCKRYYPQAIAHLSATYGALLGDEFVFDMTRIGIGLYGYLPDGARDLPKQKTKALNLKKGMEIYATVSASRKFIEGGAGYGEDLISKPNRVYTCRIGYADGFLRKKNNGVLGAEDNANNFCMDACVRVGAKRKGTRVLIMSDAARTAKKTGTISYEVLCAATRRAEIEYD